MTTHTNAFANDEKQPLNVQPYGYGYSAGTLELVSITGDAEVAEGGTATYTVSLTKAVDTRLKVDIIYNLKDVDKGEIIEETKEVYLEPGQTEVSFTVRNVDDNFYEGNEVYNVGINGVTTIADQSPSGVIIEVDPSKQNVDTVIIDNEKDKPNTKDILVSIEGDADVPEGDEASYTVSLSEASSVSVTVDIVYTLKDVEKGEIIEKTTSIRLDPGETSKSFTVENLDDTIVEGAEVYNVGIQNVKYLLDEVPADYDWVKIFYPKQKVVVIDDNKQNVDTVIIDDDKNPDPIVVSIEGDASVAEGDEASYTVSLEKPALVPVVVNIVYTLKDVDSGEIIEKTKEVKFEAGQTSVSFTVANIDDDIVEGDEVYNVGLGDVSYVINGKVVGYDEAVKANPKQGEVTVQSDKQNVDTTIIDNDKEPEPDPTPEIEDGVVYVSEEGLKGGLKDDDGTEDLTNVAVQAGSLAMTGATSVVFTDAQPTKIGETEVQWDGVNSGELTAYTDDNDNGIMDAGEEVLQATITDDGSYKVTLLDAVQHSDTTVEDVAKIDLQVMASNATATSPATKTATANLSVVIEDDSPEITAESVDIAVPPIDVNLMLVLDTSTSMGIDPYGRGKIWVDGQQMSRLDAVKIACKSAIDKYQEYGDVKVRLVTFSSSAKKVGDKWVSAEEALEQIDAMQAGGFTNYDDALIKAEDAFNDEGKIDTGINRSIFITDGAPTAWVDDNGNYGHETSRGWWNWWMPQKDESDKGIQQEEQAKWEKFIEENDINSWAVTLESSDATNTLDGIAHNGAEDDTQRNGEYVNPTELKEYLLNGIDANVTATNLVGKFGGDDGYVKTVIVDGVTYDYDVTTGEVSIDGSNANVIKFDKETDRLTLKTAKNGELTIDFDDGTYDYQASKIVSESYKETLTFTLKDNDGDSTTEDVTLNVYRADAYNDNVITNQSGKVTIDHEVLVANDSHGDNYTFNGAKNAVNAVIDDADKVSLQLTGRENDVVIKEDVFDNNINNVNSYRDPKVIDNSEFSGVTDPNAPTNAGFNWVRYDGTIHNKGFKDDDVVSISLKAGESVIIDVDGAYGMGESIDVQGYYHFNGSMVGHNTSSAPDAGSAGSNDPYFTYTATQDGTFQVTLKSDHFNERGGDFGDYQLWIGKNGDLPLANASFDYSITDADMTNTATVNVKQVDSVVLHGTNEADTLVGSDNQADTLNGGAGDDVLAGGTGQDVLNGGAGDDVIFHNLVENDYVDGGAGNDTVKVNGTGVIDAFDANIENVEVIDMKDNQQQTLNLSADDVLNMTDGNNTLFVKGDADDNVNLTGLQKVENTGSMGEDGYVMYSDTGTGTAEAFVYISDDVVL